MLQMYSVYDKKSQSYSPPSFSKNVVQLQRDLTMFMREQKQSPFAQFPADFAVYLVGTFDQETGHILFPFEQGPQFTFEITNLLEAPNAKVP